MYLCIMYYSYMISQNIYLIYEGYLNNDNKETKNYFYIKKKKRIYKIKFFHLKFLNSFKLNI